MDNEEIKKLLQELKESSDESNSVRTKVVKIHFDTPAEAERRRREKKRAEEREARKKREEEEKARAEEEARRLEAEKAAKKAVEEAKKEAKAGFASDLEDDLIQSGTSIPEAVDDVDDTGDLNLNWSYEKPELTSGFAREEDFDIGGPEHDASGKGKADNGSGENGSGSGSKDKSRSQGDKDHPPGDEDADFDSDESDFRSENESGTISGLPGLFGAISDKVLSFAGGIRKSVKEDLSKTKDNNSKDSESGEEETSEDQESLPEEEHESDTLSARADDSKEMHELPSYWDDENDLSSESGEGKGLPGDDDSDSALTDGEADPEDGSEPDREEGREKTRKNRWRKHRKAGREKNREDSSEAAEEEDGDDADPSGEVNEKTPEREYGPDEEWKRRMEEPPRRKSFFERLKSERIKRGTSKPAKKSKKEKREKNTGGDAEWKDPEVQEALENEVLPEAAVRSEDLPNETTPDAEALGTGADGVPTPGTSAPETEDSYAQEQGAASGTAAEGSYAQEQGAAVAGAATATAGSGAEDSYSQVPKSIEVIDLNENQNNKDAEIIPLVGNTGALPDPAEIKKERSRLNALKKSTGGSGNAEAAEDGKPAKTKEKKAKKERVRKEKVKKQKPEKENASRKSKDTLSRLFAGIGRKPKETEGQPAGENGQPAGENDQPAGADGQYVGPDGQYAGADGQYVGPDGQYVGPDGQYVGPDGQYVGPDGQYVRMDGLQADGNGMNGQPVPGDNGMAQEISGGGGDTSEPGRSASRSFSLGSKKKLLFALLGVAAVIIIVAVIGMVVMNMPKTRSATITADEGMTVDILEQPESYTESGDVKIRVKAPETIQSITVNGENVVVDQDRTVDFTYHATGGTLDVMAVSTDKVRSAKIILAYVDSAPPSVTIKEQDGNIVMSAEDQESGLEGIYIGRFEGLSGIPQYERYSEPLKEDPDTEIMYYAKDVAGNSTVPAIVALTPAKSIEFEKERYTVFPGNVFRVNLITTPEHAFVNNLELEAENPKVVQVEGGFQLRGLAEGDTKITATADGIAGVMASVSVSNERKVTISAIGDCTLGTDSNFSQNNSFSAYESLYGSSYFFEKVKGILSSDDSTFANFEGTLTTSEARKETKIYAFKGDPSYTQILLDGSIDTVTLANNHCDDYGDEGEADTHKALEDAGIEWCKDDHIAYRDLNGVLTAYIGIYALENGLDTIPQVKSTIAEAKKKGAELIIIEFHWGAELVAELDEFQQELAHAAVDAGANLVLGSHAHVLQGIEKYNGAYIVYGLANFCFGGNTNPTSYDTMIWRQTFTFTADGLESEDDIAIIPCQVSGDLSSNNYQPVPVSGDAAKNIMDTIDSLSAQFGQSYSQYMVDGTLWSAESEG